MNWLSPVWWRIVVGAGLALAVVGASAGQLILDISGCATPTATGSGNVVSIDCTHEGGSGQLIFDISGCATPRATGSGGVILIECTRAEGSGQLILKLSGCGMPSAASSGSMISISCAQDPSFQGLWWKAPAGSESGWGINLAHQGDVIFATWYTYDLGGKAWWLSITAGMTAENTYSGTLYQTAGPPFSSQPFDPNRVTRTPVGTGTLTFTGARSGTFSYTVNGTSRSKAIVPQEFGFLPTCIWGAQPDLTKAANYQDLWWASPSESESGWGVNLAHQGDKIFATWYTYDFDGTPMWLSATASKTSSETYTGTLYRATGPSYNADPFDPNSVIRTPVGTLTLSFSDGNAASYAYTVMMPGSPVVTQTKRVTRQIFRAPGTTCQ